MESRGSLAVGADALPVALDHGAIPPSATLLLAAVMIFLIGWAEGKGQKAPSSKVLHAVRGRVIPIGGQPLSAAKVRLATNDGEEMGERTLAYEGMFAFENLLPGQYILTLDRENEATVGRTVEIKSYPAPKVIFLEITLNKESASVREIVTDATNREFSTLRVPPSQVSRKALREFERAAKESARGAPANAIVHLQRAIRDQPDYFEAHNNLGVQHQKLRQWDQAILSYRRAIELRPNSAKARVNLAAVLLEQGQTQTAMESLEAASKAEPDSAFVYLALGELYFRQRAYLKAEKSLETATRLNAQGSRRAFELLVQIALQHQEMARARQYLEVMKQYFTLDSEILRLESLVPSAAAQ